ncbi:MAG: hypothetical protein F4Y14_13655 [Acidobacteria bacterium]|nr:hypothetical protein [Acidobacteriota bacterium]
MPDITEDARKVQDHIDRIFDADPHDRAEAIRRLFVEVLDFHGAAGQVSLAGAAKGVELPDFAERIASLDGVHVLWVALTSKRVNTREAAGAARLIEKELGEDLLLVCTNLEEKLADADQLHLILPDFGTGTTPTLRRRTVERGLPQRTAFLEIAGIYSKAKGVPVRTAISEAFDVEPVTRDFFREYKRIFEAAKDMVTGFKATSSENEQEEEERLHLFVQTLFNRLLFVHFLSRKGWLTFNDNKNYLNALWQDYKSTSGETNFHRDRLRRLFFDGLSNPESESRTYPDIGKVPFLNGGLFEETPLDKRPSVTVPDEAIEPLLFELFGRFNFTVMESTPFDVEVAVDPEMLGKVFEELVTGRHDSGSYYTPRPVVSFMCREALKGYLEGCETGLDAEAIGAFVDEKRTEDTVDVPAARKVAGALSDVTVVDPACGSGDYLLGMMQELVELQTVLFNAGADRKSLHALKLEIIERNLHGVDNDGFAVNIAMLRLWLSLAIEDEPPIDPLPNLNFKIVCGDSLLGPDPSGLSFDRVTIEQSGLGRLKGEYLRESDADQKERLRGEIEAVREQVGANLGGTAVPEDVIDWRVEFAEVFASLGGFDIAIANPPYVRHEKVGLHLRESDPPDGQDQAAAKAYKKTLTSLYTDAVTARSDLYCHFYLRALQLLNGNGMHVFVCSNAWLDSSYGARLQEYVLRHAHLSAVYESAVERQFSTADINTVISVIRRAPGQDTDETRFVSLRAEFGTALARPELRRVVVRSRGTLLAEGSDGKKYAGDKWGGKFLRAPDIYHAIWRAAPSSRVALADAVVGERYLNTGGADGFFVLTDVKPAETGMMDVVVRSKEGEQWNNPRFKIESQFLLPGYRKAGSRRLRVAPEPDCYILAIPPATKVHTFEVAKYIKWGEQAGFNKRSVTRTQEPWWRPSRQAQSGSLLLWPRTHSDAHRCYYNPARLVSLRFFRLHPKRADTILPLLGILNSTVFALLKEVHGRRGLGQGALESGLVDIMPLPIPNVAEIDSERIAECVTPLLDRDIGNVADEILRDDRIELDRAVLGAYGVDEDWASAVHAAAAEMTALRLEKAKRVGA